MMLPILRCFLSKRKGNHEGKQAGLSSAQATRRLHVRRRNLRGYGSLSLRDQLLLLEMPPHHRICLQAHRNPPSTKPSMHIFVGSKAPWYEILDDLPQFDGFPD